MSSSFSAQVIRRMITTSNHIAPKKPIADTIAGLVKPKFNSDGTKALVARHTLAAGVSIIDLTESVMVNSPSRTSIEFKNDNGKNMHAENYFGSHVNHSCKSNAIVIGSFIKTTELIKSGKEISFNYAESEQSMAAPFICDSGCCDGYYRTR